MAANGTGTYEGLEIDEDYRFQRFQWMVERGWAVVLGLLIVAAIVGVSGNGLLGSETSRDGDLQVQWDRFLRRDAPMTLRVRAEGTGSVAITFTASYLEAMEVESIEPEPIEVESGGGLVTHEFAVVEGADGVEATFRLRPRESGRVRAEIESGGDRVEFSQFVYP